MNPRKIRNRCLVWVAILVLVDSVLQSDLMTEEYHFYVPVAILVLVDSVLQLENVRGMIEYEISRNPCFSGQCFAIAPKNARNRAKNSKYCLDFRSFCASHKIELLFI